ncbi:MAG: hypothetical protein QOJ06_489 [Pseudonocardiales bacterium]|jgi:hypothetical protein|nr:hypothetical protein [Pseudonocardiales bacterium]
MARLGPPFRPDGWCRLVTSQCRRAGRTSAGRPGLPANACPGHSAGVIRKHRARGSRPSCPATSPQRTRRPRRCPGREHLYRGGSYRAGSGLFVGPGQEAPEPAGHRVLVIRGSESRPAELLPDRPGMLQPQPSREEMLRDVLAEHLKRPLHAGRHQSRTKSLSETAPHPPSDTDRGFTARPSGRRRADPPGRVVVQTVTMGSRCPQRATLTPWDGGRPRRRRGRGRPQGHRPSAVHRSLVVCTPCWLSNAPAAACC